MGTTTKTAGVTWLNGHVWRDGEAAPAAASVLHDRGFVLGDGLFETLLVRDGLPVLWQAHIDRLAATARALHFPTPGGFAAEARAAFDALIDRADEGVRQRASLRITVTRGGGTAYGLDAPEAPTPTVMMRLTAARRRSRAHAQRETAWVVDQPRIDPGNVLSGHKTTSSMWRVLAHETARSQGADLALLKTIDGDVGEADTACVLALIDNVVVTPPLSRGILPSTTRAFVLAELDAAGRAWQERELYPAEVHTAAEVILSSSVSGIRALAAVDGHGLPAEAPLAEWLDERYEQLPGGL
jgi:branched-subunit amino acid aminotransferase/4-amino-4-deoxychorismate lyase